MKYLIEEVKDPKEKINYFKAGGDFDRLIITGNKQCREHGVWYDIEDEQYGEYYGVLFGNFKYPSMADRLEKYDGNVKDMVEGEFGEKENPYRMWIWEDSLDLLYNGETDDEVYRGVTGVLGMVFGGDWRCQRITNFDDNEDWEYFIWDDYKHDSKEIREIACEYYDCYREYRISEVNNPDVPFSLVHVYPWENPIEVIKSNINFDGTEDLLFKREEVVVYKYTEM